MTDLRGDFKRRNPTFPLLTLGDRVALEAVLRDAGQLSSDETLASIETAGEGNMNLTLRVRITSSAACVGSERSVIVKQSRPWVEKYDFIPAPLDRALVEAHFYRETATIDGVAECMPRLIGVVPSARVLVLEDLGAASDLSSLYVGDDSLTKDDTVVLGRYLRCLHEETRSRDLADLDNLEMRRLNAEHIFDVPYATDNGVDVDALEPGLGGVAAEIRGDRELRRRIAELKARYLDRGPCLLHGDFFPGSWLRSSSGTLSVIDPEFCFPGDPEFDVGVAVAHLCMAGASTSLVDSLLEEASRGLEHDPALIARCAGAEILRRLLGVAQLPIAPTQRRRRELVRHAREAVCRGDLESLRPKNGVGAT